MLLFTYAEAGEDVVECLLRGDFGAGYFGEVMEAESQVFADEVGGDVFGEGRYHSVDVFGGCCEGLIVACVGHHDVSGRYLRYGSQLHEPVFQSVDVGSVLGRNKNDGRRFRCG